MTDRLECCWDYMSTNGDLIAALKVLYTKDDSYHKENRVDNDAPSTHTDLVSVIKKTHA